MNQNNFSTFEEAALVDFPSVTFCKKYIFDNPNPAFLDEMEMKSPIFDKSWVINNSLGRETLFTFINHKSMRNESNFNCNTIDGTTLSGQPCIFPFLRRDCGVRDPVSPTRSFYCDSFDLTNSEELHYNCTYVEDVRPWCATRVFKNSSMVPSYYGYCSPDCDGSLPRSESSKNLASPLFSHLWQQRMFDLDPWKSGHCHTYTSTDHFTTGKQGNLYAFLGDGMETSRLSLRGYYIYIHSAEVMFTRKISVRTKTNLSYFICLFTAFLASQ